MLAIIDWIFCYTRKKFGKNPGQPKNQSLWPIHFAIFKSIWVTQIYSHVCTLRVTNSAQLGLFSETFCQQKLDKINLSIHGEGNFIRRRPFYRIKNDALQGSLNFIIVILRRHGQQQSWPPPRTFLWSLRGKKIWKNNILKKWYQSTFRSCFLA